MLTSPSKKTHFIPITLEYAQALYDHFQINKHAEPFTVYVISTSYNSAFAMGRAPIDWGCNDLFFTSALHANSLPHIHLKDKNAPDQTTNNYTGPIDTAIQLDLL